MFNHPWRRGAATTLGVLVLALACSAVRTRAADAAGTIPIPNADLEEGDASPAQWNASQQDDGTGTWAWDTENAHSGKRAFRLRKDNAEGYSELTSPCSSARRATTHSISTWPATSATNTRRRPDHGH
ncbi:MAG: hypothetical protein A3K19_16270 [Lentisphaerae bacterium RIFOXYB12_FULL_65_16]|nr:MAG: hypothetical protein A3K18_20575 [Lentisphaerae bacterium RIFOXYA12_64_32]OGV84490.1 MAG: hypothetical protein A3K19_16270 [Lentisphaerae bacterium RIFOXYB12_FULL_65_16]